MVKTVTQTDIITEAFGLVEMILSSNIYQEYTEALTIVQRDINAQEMLWEFNKRKADYEEVQRFGKYHPDFNQVSKEVRALKRKLDLCDPIANFKKAEKQLEELLNEISVIIAHAVSESIKVPTGNPYFDSMSCSGGCGSGGSCGCK